MNLQQIESIREVLDGQSRALDTEQSQTEPDCSRIRLLERNICTLAEHICAIAARYLAAGDPIAAKLRGRAGAVCAREGDRAAAVRAAGGVSVDRQRLAQGPRWNTSDRLFAGIATISASSNPASTATACTSSRSRTPQRGSSPRRRSSKRWLLSAV